MTTESTKQLLEKARSESLARLTQARIEYLRATDEYEELRGKDNYERSLIATLEGFPNGLPLSKAKLVFQEVALLTSARKKLQGMGELSEEKDGATITLKAVMPVRVRAQDDAAPVERATTPAPQSPEVAAAK